MLNPYLLTNNKSFWISKALELPGVAKQQTLKSCACRESNPDRQRTINLRSCFVKKIGQCTAFHVRTRQVPGSNPGGNKIIKNGFDFFTGTVSRLQLILRILDNCNATIFSLRTLNTVPVVKILKDMCFFTNETGEKWLQTPKSNPPFKTILSFIEGWELFLPSRKHLYFWKQS